MWDLVIQLSYLESKVPEVLTFNIILYDTIDNMGIQFYVMTMFQTRQLSEIYIDTFFIFRLDYRIVLDSCKIVYLQMNKIIDMLCIFI